MTPTINLLCNDAEQRTAIESQLGVQFTFAYSGQISTRPSSLDLSVPTLLDLNDLNDSDFSTVMKDAQHLVVNSDVIAEFDDLRLSVWKRNVSTQLLGDVNGSAELRAHPNFWVLCASTNGPNTVSEFLNAVPADTGDSFMLLQHIKESFVKSLREILMKSTSMHVVASTRSEKIKPNTIYICPPSRTPRIADGRLYWDTKKASKFSPCIDESLESLSTDLGHRLRAIVFTGMGKDCLKGCKAVSSAGGTVWAQSLETATMDSMPKSVIEAGIASEVRDVAGLAKLVAAIKG